MNRDRRALLVAADIADAVDPTLSETERATAANRAARTCPTLAVHMATALAHGMLRNTASRHPEGAAGVMRQLRARVADLAGTEVEQ